MRFPSFLAALVVAAPATAGAAPSFEIGHDPVTCVSADRYARITATATPADQVARAELQFRVPPDGAWYSAAMAGSGGTWSAFLPRPMRDLAQFEYRIAMTSAQLETVTGAPVAVRVSGDPECVAAGQLSVDAPVVVSVPAGAPVVPPVPFGFSPTGVVAARLSEAPKKKTPVVLVGGLVAAAGIAGVAATTGSGPPPAPVGLPTISFFGASPQPGTEISLSTDRLVLSIQVTGEPRAPMTFSWDLDMGSVPAPGGCRIAMRGFESITDVRPLTVQLTAPLERSGLCPDRFSVQDARLIIVLRNQVVFDATQTLPYSFRP
jgi:hypothetical protein